mgnify:CR=1 FL=1
MEALSNGNAVVYGRSTGTDLTIRATGTDKTPPALSDKPFYAQVADFNMDTLPDLLLVQSQSGSQIVSVYDYAAKKTIFGPYRVSEGGWGGPAVIADFDGDKVPDFGLASASNYYTYALKCAASPKPADCKSAEPGVLWAKKTHDQSSGGTGSSVFDFNGDGIAEVVYRDECWLRVFNGPDGKKLFAAPVTSGTALDEPVIADVDSDGHAEIVVASDGAQNDGCRTGRWSTELGIPHPGVSFGVRVFEDPEDRWSPARPIWNQHSYHITNINDDRTVPVRETESWKAHNTYRQNLPQSRAGSEPRPDPTGRIEFPPDTGDCVKLFRLSGVVCNRGAAPLPAGLPATFYLGSPLVSGHRTLCTARTEKPVAVGDCQAISCDWLNPSPLPYDLWLRVNDDGKGGHPVTECRAGNDLAHLSLADCPAVPR